MNETIFTRGGRLLMAGLVAVTLTGCEGILDVSDPDIVTPDNLQDEIGLQTLRNGAIGLVTVAFAGGGSTDGVVTLGSLMSDEMMHSGTFTTRFQIETLNIQDNNGTLGGAYERLHRGRVAAEDAAAKLTDLGADPNTDERIPEMFLYAGLTYIGFGENYCNGVPFSLQPESGDVVYGDPETGTQIFDRAIASFQAAQSHPAVSSDVLNAARVGEGRALLNQGQFAAAAAAVSAVPDDFVKYWRHSNNTGGQRNSVFELNVTVGRWSLGDTEGINGLDFRTAGDPRITSALCAGCAFDTSEQVPGTPAVGDNWSFTNVTDRSDPLPLATGIEARLIEAEAALQAGNAAGWLAELNALRADWTNLASVILGDDTGSLPALADPATAAGREDLHFRERAFWLFSTGHRLGDLRRLVRQYGRAPNTVYPTGPYWKPGASYGTDYVLIPPDNEENNPLFQGCLDRNP